MLVEKRHVVVVGVVVGGQVAWSNWIRTVKECALLVRLSLNIIHCISCLVN
jgi:hypothetical protein